MTHEWNTEPLADLFGLLRDLQQTPEMWVRAEACHLSRWYWSRLQTEMQLVPAERWDGSFCCLIAAPRSLWQVEIAVIWWNRAVDAEEKLLWHQLKSSLIGFDLSKSYKTKETFVALLWNPNYADNELWNSCKGEETLSLSRHSRNKSELMQYCCYISISNTILLSNTVKKNIFSTLDVT